MHSIQRKFLISLLLLGAGLWPVLASADIYMQYGKITGDVTALGYENQVGLDSANWGMGRQVDLTQSPASIGLPMLSEVTFSKLLDSASSGLAAEFLQGKVGNVVVIFTNVDVELARMELCDVVITSLSTSAGFGTPSESFTIAFTSIKISYYDLNGQPGDLSGPPFMWDTSTQKPGSCSVANN